MTDNNLRRLTQAAKSRFEKADAHWLREGRVDFDDADLFFASERDRLLEAAETEVLEDARLNDTGAEKERDVSRSL